MADFLSRPETCSRRFRAEPNKEQKNQWLSFRNLVQKMVMIGEWKKDIQDHLQHLQPLHNRMTPNDMFKKLPLTRQGLLLKHVQEITTYPQRFTVKVPSKVCQKTS
ncbi:hypothetical protein RDI58_029068 [Solanum bulbocastanum]|uniref:Uncharacterized protein n=1 Tax=Solanum bulbocastanum TaxID=147425 RepID=A0AAN8XZL2_SOLBU